MLSRSLVEHFSWANKPAKHFFLQCQGTWRFVREPPSPACKCKILQTEAANTEGWQFIMTKVWCEVASERLWKCRAKCKWGRLALFAGQDQCTFQLKQLSNVQCVPQSSWGCAWPTTPWGVIIPIAPKTPMPGCPGCRDEFSFSPETSFCNRELGGNNSAGWCRRHLAEFGRICVTSACAGSLGWEAVGLCSCSTQQHDTPRECVKHGKQQGSQNRLELIADRNTCQV